MHSPCSLTEPLHSHDEDLTIPTTKPNELFTTHVTTLTQSIDSFFIKPITITHFEINVYS